MSINKLNDFEIKEVIKNLELEDKEWTKSLVKIQWGDNPVSLDVRRINISKNIVGRGISFYNDEEIDNLVDSLLLLGYGSKNVIQYALDEKNKALEGSDE